MKMSRFRDLHKDNGRDVETKEPIELLPQLIKDRNFKAKVEWLTGKKISDFLKPIEKEEIGNEK